MALPDRSGRLGKGRRGLMNSTLVFIRRFWLLCGKQVAAPAAHLNGEELIRMIPLPASRSRARHRTRVIASMSAGAALIAGALVAAPANAAPPQTVDPTHPDFGPNVTIFSPDDPAR